MKLVRSTEMFAYNLGLASRWLSAETSGKKGNKIDCAKQVTIFHVLSLNNFISVVRRKCFELAPVSWLTFNL